MRIPLLVLAIAALSAIAFAIPTPIPIHTPTPTPISTRTPIVGNGTLICGVAADCTSPTSEGCRWACSQCTTCERCAATDACGWCPSSSFCIPAFGMTPASLGVDCPGDFYYDPSQCAAATPTATPTPAPGGSPTATPATNATTTPAHGASPPPTPSTICNYPSCRDCNMWRWCGWSISQNRCLEGSSTGSNDGTSSGSDWKHRSPGTCPAVTPTSTATPARTATPAYSPLPTQTHGASPTATPTPAPTATQAGRCGDGVCDEFEQRSGACPQDCGQPTPAQTQPSQQGGAGGCGGAGFILLAGLAAIGYAARKVE